MEILPALPPPKKGKAKELTNEERIQAVSMLVGITMVRELDHSDFHAIGKKFGVKARTVRRVWNLAETARETGVIKLEEITSKNVVRGQNRKKWNEESLFEAIKAIQYRKRGTWEQLADQIDAPATTLRRLKGKGLFKHTSPLKPFLTDEHMIARIDHVLSKIDPERPEWYRNMYDEVHVDEKWFFLTEDGRTFVLCEGEEPPKRKVRHKSYIAKVMFLCAQARPRMVGGTYWDGKIGIWPFGRMVPAKRTSIRRPAGTPEWENHTIDRDEYREMMITNVLPAIINKFPWSYLTRAGKSVKIQQDGAKSHIEEDDELWLQAVEELGVNVELYTQAAQSPDLNINDLAFFRSIMSIYRREAPRNSLELIAAVEKAYDDYPATKINRMWLTLQSVCNEILKDDGNNDYKMPHMGKSKLERENRLPTVLQVHPDAEKYRFPEINDENTP